jgi:hypothetical protein
MSLTGKDLLGGPPPTLLPEEPGPRDLLERGADPADVAAAHPTSSLAWAVLAEQALARSAQVEAYAYARTGYHRGLDALRRSGWKGYGPVPWVARAEPRLPARAARARCGRRRHRARSTRRPGYGSSSPTATRQPSRRSAAPDGLPPPAPPSTAADL